MKPIKKLLIANHGECRARIARTASRMAITPVALKSSFGPGSSGSEVLGFRGGAANYDPDHSWGGGYEWITVEGSAHASPCAPLSAQHFLDIRQLIRWAHEWGADAVHPGWGFLSEEPDFAAAVVEAGLIWVGPTAEAMKELACKFRSRQLAEKLSIPVLEGSSRLYRLPDDERALMHDGSVAGYPLLLKYSAGGGGRGLVVVRHQAQLREKAWKCFDSCRKFFGDSPSSGLMLERYYEDIRHIEVQVLADGHGQVLTLGCREGTIQRRHQKMIEEAPPPFLSTELQGTLCAHAAAMMAAVSYRGAGTVEFIVESPPSVSEKLGTGGLAGCDQELSYRFLEVNTRLQVEHGLTEELYGVDLVEWQLRIARGEKLSEAIMSLGESQPEGAAVEARICAEDPLMDFMPRSGVIQVFQRVPDPHSDIDNVVEQPSFKPQAPVRIRVDHDESLAPGYQVTPGFDSLIAKVVVWGPDRGSALKALRSFLTSLYVAPMAVNSDFLAFVLAQDDFRDRASYGSSVPQWHQLWLKGTGEIRSSQGAKKSAMAEPGAEARFRSLQSWGEVWCQESSDGPDLDQSALSSRFPVADFETHHDVSDHKRSSRELSAPEHKALQIYNRPLFEAMKKHDVPSRVSLMGDAGVVSIWPEKIASEFGVPVEEVQITRHSGPQGGGYEFYRCRQRGGEGDDEGGDDEGGDYGSVLQVYDRVREQMCLIVRLGGEHGVVTRSWVRGVDSRWSMKAGTWGKISPPAPQNGDPSSCSLQPVPDHKKLSLTPQVIPVRSSGDHGTSDEGSEKIPAHVKAPTAGMVVAVMAKQGGQIHAGDTVIIIESMKMELAVPAIYDGVVGEVCVARQQYVKEGQKIMVYASESHQTPKSTQ